MILAPSVLSADFGRLAEEVAAVTEAGADWIHVDVMDGRFVPNLTIGPPVLAALRRASRLPLDVHLMIERPDELLGAFRDAGADVLTVHVEACVHLQRTLARIRSLGMRAGVALNPHTPPESIRYVLDDVDLVLVMTVNPGFGGQSFLPAMLPKLQRLRELLAAGDPARAPLQSAPGAGAAPENRVDIEVDGGISPATIGEAAAAGATVFVAGNAVFAQPDYRRALLALREQVGRMG
ncbi:MAG: ribulose-phosphate 3-epimerase [Myxococcota bacterium]|jgi:ribulose-phosphate 3-epimerase|nr:ribulose-phosphate 3-epimerase [Myxococcota bacterium]